MEQGPRTLTPRSASQIAPATLPGTAAAPASHRHPHHSFELKSTYARSTASSSQPLIRERTGSSPGPCTRTFEGHFSFPASRSRPASRPQVADCSARHRIEVPRGVAVKVEEDDGSVRAQGFEEALSIHTQDGSVRVTDSTGPLTLSSDDGSIRATGVGSRRVHATTQDGSVHLELGVVPDLVESSSHDGSVTIVLPHDTYRVSAHSADGSVHVSVPRGSNSSHVVDARTRDGSVTVRTAG
ncbi:DUF4097 family beta strand repeat-containing protein [Streptomyces yaanensis]|uniref:DUF4097 family beta strand repeat-containing protein n=1 Tax=Streptomyces yaanensis TaxID=1142239 RepID=A0ABV7SIB3_9ACTN|nr:DUF4097 family beta strand repeat-containing protein [Streptomyces sp. CGMCC 4.7035]WNC01599.1 DUF4097 family beta strand repeat-containing protein [Streptomyces sp. CGMCC 4.7035]